MSTHCIILHSHTSVDAQIRYSWTDWTNDYKMDFLTRTDFIPEQNVITKQACCNRFL